MALRDFYSGTFGFLDRDIRIGGTTISGGQSLSGIDDPIRTDGGGYVIADFANGALVDRETNLAWRALTTGMDGGATAVVVHFCDARFQPVGSSSTVPHDDNKPFDDDALYLSNGTAQALAAAASLRAVFLTLSDVMTDKDIIGGEWFAIKHATWGWRAYNIISFDGSVIEFRPPLREAIPSATHIYMDDVRCQMTVRDVPSRATSGRLGRAAITFVEDMRKPA